MFNNFHYDLNCIAGIYVELLMKQTGLVNFVNVIIEHRIVKNTYIHT